MAECLPACRNSEAAEPEAVSGAACGLLLSLSSVTPFVHEEIIHYHAFADSLFLLPLWPNNPPYGTYFFVPAVSYFNTIAQKNSNRCVRPRRRELSAWASLCRSSRFRSSRFPLSVHLQPLRKQSPTASEVNKSTEEKEVKDFFCDTKAGSCSTTKTQRLERTNNLG